MPLEDKLDVIGEQVYLRCGTVAIDTEHTEGPYIAVLVDQDNGREPALILATRVTFKFVKGDYQVSLGGGVTEGIPSDVRARICSEPGPGDTGAGDDATRPGESVGAGG